MNAEFAPGFCHELGRKCVDARKEIERLRAALKTIHEAIVHKRSVSGHIDYKPLRKFIESALEQKADTE